MELVIGGAFQGKLTWALRHYGLTMADVCDLAAGDPVPGGGRRHRPHGRRGAGVA